MNFCMGIHNHQPVGNFGWVIEKINEEAYRPFLGILADYPKIKFSLHLSGSLCAWFEDNDPKLLDLIGKMIVRGQVEILTGGYYEPVLAAIPRRDRLGQIEKFQKYIQKRFGVRPSGLWLTERVWEPALTEDLVQAGIEYVVVDDRHFLVTGFQKKSLDRYYVTESNGAYLKVFPIDMKTRALIPFKPVREIKAYLALAHRRGMQSVFYFDDGEKFGAWPGTHDWVYKKGWLGDFLAILSDLQGKIVKTKTYAEVLKENAPGGLCYLPTASYAEMEDWALPPDSFQEIKKYRSKVEAEFAEPSPYVRGSIWKNFLVKYPEANRMHKFMLETSEAVEARTRKMRPAVREQATDALYQAQCNDAYWHGVFGGLYLPHLRHHVWGKLSEVQEILNHGLSREVQSPASVGGEAPGVRFDSGAVSARWDLVRGGVLSRFLVLRKRMNLLNTLARHEEGYHEKLTEMIRQLQPGAFSPLLEGRFKAPRKTERSVSDDIFFYDRSDRDAFIDGFFDFKRSSREDFERRELFKVHHEEPDVRYRLKLNALHIEYTSGCWKVLKSVTFLAEKGFQVAYRIKNTAARTAKGSFGTEINFHMPYPETRTEAEGSMSFWDDVTKTLLRIESEPACEFWHYPIETYHQSESGCEKTYQGTCVMPFVQLKLAQHQSFEWVTRLVVD